MINKSVSYYVYVFSKDIRKLILQSEHETLAEAKKTYDTYIKLSSISTKQVNIINITHNIKTQEFELIKIK